MSDGLATELSVAAVASNKQLQRTVMRRRGVSRHIGRRRASSRRHHI